MGASIISTTIAELESLGIEEIIVVHSPQDEMVDILKSDSVRFVQQESPQGMADAILCAKPHLNDRFLVLNPQQLNIGKHLNNLPSDEPGDGVILFSKTTSNPSKYGMLGLDGQRVTRVVEKPETLDGLSDQRILGIYILTRKFIDFLETVPTDMYQLENALSEFSQNENVRAIQSEADSMSLKYAWDLFKIKDYLLDKALSENRIHPDARIHPSALVDENVIIEEGTQVYEYAIIKGPCYIGKNAVIGSYTKVRGASVIEEGAELQNMVEVKNSHIGKGTHIHSGYIGDSIIGENVGIGAGFITANKRLDRKSIACKIKDNKVDTNRTALGSIIGDNVKIGIQSGTNPGAIIEEDKIIYPATIVT